MFALASALPEPVVEETGELLARGDSDGTPAQKGVTGEDKTEGDRTAARGAGIAVMVAGTAAPTGTAAIRTICTSGGAARGDIAATGGTRTNPDASVSA
ncbi:hypothetical protein CTheo_5652 [Ceratobasidium theobromae]|uniref:Uncharacterized protein n=1 Tax=Ceratobasidium theobromae TaxID=1582974 RepID=A0A5N5QGP7_9AGAM|nr:hypothetical protein CTheo_5652 [Ceratobasidium theobromae]